MSRYLSAAAALALLCACAGYTSGEVIGGTPPGSGTSNGLPDAGDAGTDGGIDGGFDAGCAQLSLNGVGASDDCVTPGSPIAAVANVTIAAADAGNACAVNITLTTATGFCTGTASHGTLDAFTGACAALNCTSPSIPGTLTCNGGCTIRICGDAGACGP